MNSSYSHDYNVVEKWNQIKPNQLKRVYLILRYIIGHIFFVVSFLCFKLLPIVLVYLRERKTIHRNVAYSTVRKCCYLDVYSAPHSNNSTSPTQLFPVVLFAPGGAWATHKKSHYITFANNLRKQGIVVVVINYTHFPNGQIDHMVDDLDLSLRWVEKNIEKYHGDPKNIYLMGHSAGAHISLLYLCNRTIGVETNGEKIQSNSEKKFPLVRGFIGLSGPYHIKDHYLHETKRGLENLSPMKGTMKGIENFDLYSPTFKIRTMEFDPQISHLFCRVYLMHGSRDLTVPTSSSIKLFKELKNKGVFVEYMEYENFSHLDPIFSIMSGCKKEDEKKYLNDLKKIVYGEWVSHPENSDDDNINIINSNGDYNNNTKLNNRKPNISLRTMQQQPPNQ